jgi:hypothetical protein
MENAVVDTHSSGEEAARSDAAALQPFDRESEARLKVAKARCVPRFRSTPEAVGPPPCTSWNSALAAECRTFACKKRRLMVVQRVAVRNSHTGTIIVSEMNKLLLKAVLSEQRTHEPISGMH